MFFSKLILYKNKLKKRKKENQNRRHFRLRLSQSHEFYQTPKNLSLSTLIVLNLRLSTSTKTLSHHVTLTFTHTKPSFNRVPSNSRLSHKTAQTSPLRPLSRVPFAYPSLNNVKQQKRKSTVSQRPQAEISPSMRRRIRCLNLPAPLFQYWFFDFWD